MKVSRDRARERLTPEKIKLIQNHIKKIADMGANCVAIGTPYNDEFLPYTTLWVQEARKNNLRVWFRGNWAEWEGWFNYPKGMTTATHVAKTKQFIAANKTLFEDGDIFTAAPEAENGGPFAPLDTPQKYQLFREFLGAQATEIDKSFQQIGKNITTNWSSMSGGVAKSVFTSQTVKATGNIVTLDHYVSDPSGMDEYILHFQQRFQADLVFGEFGAPIPDINGKMTENEQKEFVEQLFARLYYYSPYIKGVNYWTLSESSTALLAPDHSELPVVESIRKYYQPAEIRGTITNTAGDRLPGLQVRVAESLQTLTTNEKGGFRLVVPATTSHLTIESNGIYEEKKIQISPDPRDVVQIDIVLKPRQQPLLYKLKSFLRALSL